MTAPLVEPIYNAILSAINLCGMVLQNPPNEEMKKQAEDTLKSQFLAKGPALLIGEYSDEIK